MKMINKIAVMIVIFILLVFLALGVMHIRENSRIKEYVNTNIAQELYINNKRFEPTKPYKLRNDIVFLPLNDVVYALGEKFEYEEKSFGKIVFYYQGTTYDLKKGSNIVYNRSTNEEIKMDGRVELMDGKLYVPLEFIKECMYVNILELSNNRVFIDSFKEQFNYDWMKDNKYIAHAMGGVDKRVYTNSLEAFEYNYKLGYRVFEIDIAMTSDGYPILLHSWDKPRLKELGLPESWNENRPNINEFLQTDINGVYTPLSMKNVCELMKEYKDIKIVIDVKGDLENCKEVYKKSILEAKKIDSKLIDRMIPQIYDEKMFSEIMKIYDFKSMIYTLYKQEKLNAQEVIDFSYENGIKVVVVDAGKLDSKFINELKQRGIYVYVNTYNDTRKVKELQKMGAKGIYSDFINPKTGENRYEDKSAQKK